MEVVEFCRESDLPELFSRFAEWYQFNPRMRERDFFDWQFRDAPVRLGPGDYDFLVLRDEKGRIAGGLGVVGFELRLGARIERAGWTHNWHGAPRGLGGFALLSRFTELVDNGFLLRISDRVQEILRLLDIPVLPAMPRWWAAPDAARACELFGLTSENDRRVLAESAQRFRRLDAKPCAAHVARLDEGEEFLLSHWPGIAGHARRSAGYLNWRYVDIPRHPYRIIRTERAFGVYRVEKVMGSDASVMRILEWTFGPDETAGALQSMVNDPEFDHPVLIDFHCTHDAIGRLLEPLGFVRQNATEAPMPDLFRPSNYSGGYAVAVDLPPHRSTRSFDADRWYMTIGDSDIDRVKL